jgi:uncharacterized membrane protein YgcG
MYYPKSQIKTNLYTNGNPPSDIYVLSTDKTLYIGYYYKISNGEVFTGKSPSDKPNILLIPQPAGEGQDVILEKNNLVEFNLSEASTEISNYINLKNIDVNLIIYLPTSSPNPPNSLDYTNGGMRRYFCKKTNQTIYLEINKDTYDKLVKQDPSILWQLYQPFTLIWTLKGNREQVAKNNQNAVERISNKLNMPMLAEFLKKDYTKYYKYPDATNLYTKGNELKTVQDNKMYIGFYHIHPDKGYMAGATHVLEPHAYLSPINGFSYSGLSFKDTSKPSPTSNTPPSTGGGMSSGGGMSGGGGYSGGGGSSGGGGY